MNIQWNFKNHEQRERSMLFQLSLSILFLYMHNKRMCTFFNSNSLREKDNIPIFHSRVLSYPNFIYNIEKILIVS